MFQAIDTLQTKGGSGRDDDMCTEHETMLNYYCNTCKRPICSDCAMFGQEHKDHEFERLNEVYTRQVNFIKNEESGLRRRLKELSAHMKVVETNIEQVSKAKEEKGKEIDEVVETMHTKLNNQLKQKLITLLSQKNVMGDEIEYLERCQNRVSQDVL